ncbi:MAG: hypothetical protein AAB316_13750 [Bacteroidota bacterium]
MTKHLQTWLILLPALLGCLALPGQSGGDCIREVLELERKIEGHDFAQNPRVVFLNYTMRTTDWEESAAVSEVRIYRQQMKVHFFSKQADVFQDEKEVLLVLHDQRTIIRNSLNAEILNAGIATGLAELRAAFLEAGKVVKCAKDPAQAGVKILEVKASEDFHEDLLIESIRYRYDLAKGKILSTFIFYEEDYKVKKIEIAYNELNFNANYEMSQDARKYVLDKNGKPKGKYAGYAVMDNRK